LTDAFHPLWVPTVHSIEKNKIHTIPARDTRRNTYDKHIHVIVNLFHYDDCEDRAQTLLARKEAL